MKPESTPQSKSGLKAGALQRLLIRMRLKEVVGEDSPKH